VVVVNAPLIISYKLLYAISNMTHLPILYIIYSHAYTDYISIVSLFIENRSKNIKIITYKLTMEELT
jgi:hypothetical protein